MILRKMFFFFLEFSKNLMGGGWVAFGVPVVSPEDVFGQSVPLIGSLPNFI